MTSHRRCHARDPQNHAYIFHNARLSDARFGNSLPYFGFAMHQNELIHVTIGFKHGVPCIVRSEARRGPLGHFSALGATPCFTPHVLTDPRGPFEPSISQCKVQQA